MHQKDIIEYLKPYLSNSIIDIKRILDVADKGGITFSDDLSQKISSNLFDKEKIDVLLQSARPNVQIDDLIKFFYVQDHSNEYYVVIKEPKELFDAGYLIKILTIS